MSIIRYTPTQDAFIVTGSVGQTTNTGLDEILQVGVCSRFGVEGSARALLDFGQIELPTEAYKATLHLYLANAYNLPQPVYSVKVCTVSQSWEEGRGKFKDEPATNDGVTWNYRNFNQDAWNVAGGNFTDGRNYVVQSFGGNNAKDVDIDVLELLQSENCNGGFILGFADESQAVNQNATLLFYSKDTHTIYRPYLQVEVDDAEYSSSLAVIDSEQIYITTEGLKPEFTTMDNVRINLKVSPKYPRRVYSTSSIYSVNHVLPVESYWGIRNEYTREMVIDFCTGTKISADNVGSYFNFDASLLEPERYYRLLYQVDLGNGRKIVFDNRNIFKVVQNNG